MKTNIIFIRHGQTNWNSLKQVQGRTNVELNEIGLYQAHLRAHKYTQMNFDYIYTSPLIRASETAYLFTKITKQKSKVIFEDLLIERCFGELEGKKYDINGFSANDSYFTSNFKNFESNKDLEKRALKLINKLVKKHPNKTIACFSHSHLMKSVLEISQNQDLSYHSEIDNCGGAHIQIEDGKIYVKKLNI